MHPDMIPSEADHSTESPVFDWLRDELFVLQGRQGSPDQITGNTPLRLIPTETAAVRSHFAMRFGDIPFEDRWVNAGMTLDEAVEAMEEKLRRRQYPPEILH